MDFTKKKPIKCRHCKQTQGNHKAGSLHCPLFPRQKFTPFHKTNTFQPKEGSR